MTRTAASGTTCRRRPGRAGATAGAPATRIPAIIVSPFARHGFVDHTAYDTTSILKLITRRFDLEPLAGVREKLGDLTAALDLRADDVIDLSRDAGEELEGTKRAAVPVG